MSHFQGMRWCFYCEGCKPVLKLLLAEGYSHNFWFSIAVCLDAGNVKGLLQAWTTVKRQLQPVMYKTEKTTGEIKRPPPVKVLSGQLRTAESRRTADSGDGYVIKPGKGRSLVVSLVWMQGTVLEVQLDRGTVLLIDETGTFAVQGVNNIPKGKPCLSQGKYVMVMGVIQAISPEPVIRAVKMADLSELAALHRRMWKLEVEDLQQALA